MNRENWVHCYDCENFRYNENVSGTGGFCKILGKIDNVGCCPCVSFRRKNRKLMTCKDCVHFMHTGASGWEPDLLTPHYFMCNYWNKSGTVQPNWKKTCRHFRRIQMNKIEIDVKINGEIAKLSDISNETIANIKKSEQLNLIEHGDYGYLEGDPNPFRLFIKIAGKIKAYDKYGICKNSNMNHPPGCNAVYKITGNIFKDLETN